MSDATASAYTEHDISRFGREGGTARRSPADAVERLRRALAHDWTDDVASPEERDLYERAFAEAFVASVMALDVRVGDEVMPDDLGKVTPAPTNIDAHYVLVEVRGDTALIRRASFPQWAPARTPLANLRRISKGTCSAHAVAAAPEFPGAPGSFWLDRDGDCWVLCEDGQFRLRPEGYGVEPDEVAHAHGPMTPVRGA